MLDGFCLCWQGSNLVTEQILRLEKTLLTTGCSQLYHKWKECTDICQQPAAAVSMSTSCCSSAMHGTFTSDPQPTPAWHGGMHSLAPESCRDGYGELSIPLYAEKLLPDSPGAWKWDQEGVMIKLMFSAVDSCMWRSIMAGTASNAVVLILSPRLLKYGCFSIPEKNARTEELNSLWTIWKQLMNYLS